jgi:hypothetical protein
VFVRLAVHVEYYCCGDGYPSGQYRYELVTVEAARCRAEPTLGRSRRAKVGGQVMERSNRYY